MNCSHQNICGGCPLRHLDDETYRATKTKLLQNIIARINQEHILCTPPVFIADGQRRRAEFTFSLQKGKLIFGFNAAKTHDIVDIDSCPSLSDSLNTIIPNVKNFLHHLCQIKSTHKIKNKIISYNITGGDIFLTAAENGIDILLSINTALTLEHRILISEFVAECPQIIRIGIRRQLAEKAEIILEKTPPIITIGSHKICIPCGTFLQVSSAGEAALIANVMRFIGDTNGNIADLFCGLGTFSYPLSTNIKNKIIAVDSSEESLKYLQKNINALTIPNISVVQRNLFKYPLDETELKGLDVLIFDPPRSGAGKQVQKIAALNFKDKPQKIVAVSCNPHTFINDANQLLAGGYKLQKITPVDQFVYTNHLELVALFEKN